MEAHSETASCTSREIEIYLFPDESPEEFLVALIEKFGSVELAVCVSPQQSSRKMIGALHAVTNGILLMNIVYLDNQSIRIPQSSERASLYQKWTLPVRWLAPGSPLGNGKGRRSSSEGSMDIAFELFLFEMGIKAMLIAADNAFTAQWIPVGSRAPLSECPAAPSAPNRRSLSASDRRRQDRREEPDDMSPLPLFRRGSARDNALNVRATALSGRSGQREPRDIVGF